MSFKYLLYVGGAIQPLMGCSVLDPLLSWLYIPGPSEINLPRNEVEDILEDSAIARISSKSGDNKNVIYTIVKNEE